MGKDFKKLFCGNFPHQLRHDGRLDQQKERPDDAFGKPPLTIEMPKESHEGAVAPELCDFKVPEQLGQAQGRGAVEKPDNDLWFHEVHERRSFLRTWAIRNQIEQLVWSVVGQSQHCRNPIILHGTSDVDHCLSWTAQQDVELPGQGTIEDFGQSQHVDSPKHGHERSMELHVVQQRNEHRDQLLPLDVPEQLWQSFLHHFCWASRTEEIKFADLALLQQSDDLEGMGKDSWRGHVRIVQDQLR
mmetsp:Transcript_146552/g.468086  ORF Transcript_146552/g.468086 Transcript_146552/m.468086 type:complete len:244 (-) Transcript_146552:415-1146(-)